MRGGQEDSPGFLVEPSPAFQRACFISYCFCGVMRKWKFSSRERKADFSYAHAPQSDTNDIKPAPNSYSPGTVVFLRNASITNIPLAMPQDALQRETAPPMKSSSIGIALAAALFGFAIGAYWASPGDVPVISDAPPAPVEKGDATTTIENASPSTPAVLSADETRARLFHILTVPNPLERMRLFTEFLPQVTADNWQQAVAAFRAQGEKEGLWFTAEWKFLMEHAGRFAGGQTILQKLRSGDESDARAMFAGWATVDPAAATSWFEQYSGTKDERVRIFTSLLDGLGRSDPQRAILLLENAGSLSKDGGDRLIESSVTAGGWRAAEDALRMIVASNRIPKEVVNLAIERMSLRRANRGLADTDPAAMLSWAEPFLPRSELATLPLIYHAATVNGEQTVAWLDSQSANLKAETLAALQNQIGEAWNSKAPAKFAEWARANLQNPHHDAVVAGAVSACARNGEFAMARTLAATIRDEAMRAKSEKESGQTPN